MSSILERASIYDSAEVEYYQTTEDAVTTDLITIPNDANEIELLKSRIEQLERIALHKVNSVEFTRKIAEKADILELRHLSERVSDILAHQTSNNQANFEYKNSFFDPAYINEMIKPHVESLKSELKREIKLEMSSQSEIKAISQKTALLQSTIEKSLRRETLLEDDRSEEIKRLKATIDHLELVQQTLTTEIQELKRITSTTSKTASAASEVASSVQNQISTFAEARQVRAEFADISTLVYKIPKLEKRLNAIEQDVIKKGFSLESDCSSANSVMERIERLHDEIVQLHQKNLDISSKKVDITVLEELMRHIATREDLKKTSKKLSVGLETAKSNFSPLRHTEALSKVEQRLMERIDQRFTLADSIDRSLESRLHASIHSKIETYVCEHISKITKSINEIKDLVPSSKNLLNDNEVELYFDRLRREFDEKLYLICSDLAELRVGFGIAGKSSLGQMFLGMLNHLIMWEANSAHIKVVEAGLYEISFAFFTKSKPSIQLVINGESVLSAINSPSYVVHHGSGFVMDGDGRMEQGSVSGLSLLDFLALPTRSTVSLHYHGKKQGHGFLSLRRVC